MRKYQEFKKLSESQVEDLDVLERTIWNSVNTKRNFSEFVPAYFNLPLRNLIKLLRYSTDERINDIAIERAYGHFQQLIQTRQTISSTLLALAKAGNWEQLETIGKRKKEEK